MIVTISRPQTYEIAYGTGGAEEPEPSLWNVDNPSFAFDADLNTHAGLFSCRFTPFDSTTTFLLKDFYGSVPSTATALRLGILSNYPTGQAYQFYRYAVYNDEGLPLCDFPSGFTKYCRDRGWIDWLYTNDFFDTITKETITLWNGSGPLPNIPLLELELKPLGSIGWQTVPPTKVYWNIYDVFLEVDMPTPTGLGIGIVNTVNCCCR